jgi:hypothetical protein
LKIYFVFSAFKKLFGALGIMVHVCTPRGIRKEEAERWKVKTIVG